MAEWQALICRTHISVGAFFVFFLDFLMVMHSAASRFHQQVAEPICQPKPPDALFADSSIKRSRLEEFHGSQSDCTN